MIFSFKINAKSIGRYILVLMMIWFAGISRILNNTCCNNVNKKIKQIKQQHCECDVFYHKYAYWMTLSVASVCCTLLGFPRTPNSCRSAPRLYKSLNFCNRRTEFNKNSLLNVMSVRFFLLRLMLNLLGWLLLDTNDDLIFRVITYSK